MSAPEDQVAHWLFAFDAAGMTAFRALALLTTHAAERRRALLDTERASNVDALPFLRACLLDTVRLWPTTPLILRQTSATTEWNGRQLPAGTGVLIFTPFFHRDPTRLPFADRFVPHMWLDELAMAALPATGLVPFSAGPGICPGRQIVLLMTSVLVGELLRASDLRITAGQRPSPERPLPPTLDHFALKFAQVSP
jgi:cytochrome P450